MHKKWVVRDADKQAASALSEKFNIDPFVAFLMVSRGIVSDMDAAFFVSKNCLMTSPLDFADMDEAVFAIGEAIDIGDSICIYGDYDCDGVTSTALLYDFLSNEGANVRYYIPSRADEGYGLNTDAIDRLHDMGVNLIVTVDNGIASVKEAQHIYDLGMRLVITDHHQLPEGELPRAEAIVNPHRPENNLKFRDYCGVGVAYKLACAMYDGDMDDLCARYMDLVAIGTIADVMPLQNENRSFVRLGLEQINTNPRNALKTFMFHNGNKQYTAADIAFQLCPRINAMGRMSDASQAVEFLLAPSTEYSQPLFDILNSENAHRQAVEREIIDDVNARIERNPKLAAGRVIVVAGKEYHQGVVGIVAAHISEKYGKPTFIIGIEDGIGHGSARSIEGFNIYDALKACSDDLLQFGGHPLAAGVTISEDKIDSFRRHINEYALAEYPTMPVQELLIDCKVSPIYLTLDLVDSLDVIEPCGAGNPQAVFGLYKLRLVDIKPLSDGKHIRMELEKNGNRIRVVKFGITPDEFPYHPGDILNVAAKVSRSIYNQRMYLSIQAVDVRLYSTDDDKYFDEKGKYDLYRATGIGDESLYPDRKACALVYKYLKKNNGYNYSLDDLYFRLQEHITYGQLMFAIKAFVQSGLIEYNDRITVNDINEKVNLEDTDVLKSLRGRLEIGREI